MSQFQSNPSLMKIELEKIVKTMTLAFIIIIVIIIIIIIGKVLQNIR